MSDKELFPCAYDDAQAQRIDTTFFSDFTIAEKFGMKEIQDTWKRSFEGWKDSIKYIVELASVMNHKCWEWYEAGRIEWSEYYKDRYYECFNYVLPEGEEDSKFPKEECMFFFKVLD